MDARLLLVAWSAAAIAVLFLGGRFFDHYFPQAVTPLAALGGAGAASFIESAAGAARRRRTAWLAVGTAIPALLCFVGALEFPATMRLLNDERRPYAAVSAYIRAHTRPSDRVFVWGYYPLIYVAADRLPASRFIGCHYLTGYAAVGLGRVLPAAAEDKLEAPHGFDTLLGELDSVRPPLFIDTAPADFHGWHRYPLSRYPRLAAYVAKHYVREAVADGAVIYRRRG